MTSATLSPAAVAARRFFRLAPAILWLLGETRSSPMDDATRDRLAGQVSLLLGAVERSVPEELSRELEMLTADFDGASASETQVRITLAQLAGWVQGTLSSLSLPTEKDFRP